MRRRRFALTCAMARAGNAMRRPAFISANERAWCGMTLAAAVIGVGVHYHVLFVPLLASRGRIFSNISWRIISTLIDANYYRHSCPFERQCRDCVPFDFT